MKLTKRLIICLLLFITPIVWGQASTESVTKLTAESTDAYDCTVVRLEDVDESTLTQAERIARMEESLLDSIDQHDSCVENVVSENAASDGAGGSFGTAGSGEGDGGAEGQAEGDAESEVEDESGEAASSANTKSNSEAQSGDNRPPVQASTGAKDKKIKSKDNDKAICKILAEEINAEKNLQKQKKLEDIYKDYQCR